LLMPLSMQMKTKFIFLSCSIVYSSTKKS